jgi:hypothetical protein
MEPLAMAANELHPPEVADQIGDRRAAQVTGDADGDDVEHAEVPAIDVEPREQHHRLRGDRDAARPGDQQQIDPGEAEVGDDVRHQVDERVGDGGELVHGRRRVACAPCESGSI